MLMTSKILGSVKLYLFPPLISERNLLQYFKKSFSAATLRELMVNKLEAGVQAELV